MRPPVNSQEETSRLQGVNGLLTDRTFHHLSCFFSMKFGLISLFFLFLFQSCNPFVYKYDTYALMADLKVDEAVHALNSLEWWYYTGHLNDNTGKVYGIEYVFFHYTTAGRKDNYLVNIAVSDPQTETFYYDYEFFRVRNPTEAGQLPLTLHKGSYHLTGQFGEYALNADMQDHEIGFALTTFPAKDPVFQNGTGYETYGDLATAGYYSYPRLDTEGVIYFNGDTIPVSGQLWYDRQWNCGNELLSPKVSWDWMSIQFNEKSEELMVYNVEDRRSDILLFGGSYHAEDGTVTDLADGDITMTPLEYWTSPESGRVYPVKWSVVIEKIQADITVEALYPHQELVLRRMGLSLPYWEGMCTATGTIGDRAVTGNAYLEMTNKPKE